MKLVPLVVLMAHSAEMYITLASLSSVPFSWNLSIHQCCPDMNCHQRICLIREFIYTGGDRAGRSSQAEQREQTGDLTEAKSCNTIGRLGKDYLEGHPASERNGGDRVPKMTGKCNRWGTIVENMREKYMPVDILMHHTCWYYLSSMQ